MPKAEYKQLNVRTEDYEFFDDFTKKLSAQMGIELKMQQALKMAVTQYEVKKALTK